MQLVNVGTPNNLKTKVGTQLVKRLPTPALYIKNNESGLFKSIINVHEM